MLTFPTSFAGTERSCSCIDGSCIQCSEVLVFTHPAQVKCATGVRTCSLITVCLELLLPPAVSSGHWSILLSTRLRVPDFWSWSESPTVSSGCFHVFSFIGIPQIDQIPHTSWRDFLTPRVTCHQAWSRFRHRRAFVRGRLLTLFWHGALLSNLIVRKKITEMAARGHRETHNVDQTKKMIPFVSWKTSFSQNVCELVFGVHMFDLDLGFQIDSVNQPIKSDFVSSGHVSHRRTSSFTHHIDHGFAVFKNVQLRCLLVGT